LVLVAEDLEGFVEDRSQLREDRAATNATAFVMLDLSVLEYSFDSFPNRCLPNAAIGFLRECDPFREADA
jgi:hypothetical protein